MVNNWAVLAGGVLVYILYVVGDFLALHFHTPSKPLLAYKRKGPEPTYALITGASAGIGLGIAQELVHQGFGVILLGHLPDELDQAKQTLERARPGAVVRTVVMDVVRATPADLEGLVKSLDGLQLSILVNNVGGCPYVLPMREISTFSCADIDRTIDMNARFMTRLTALALPILARKAGPGERSLILTMSSSSHIGLPWLTIYSATKAYNLALSRALSRELLTDPATRHVDCLTITPGDVQSQGNTQAVLSKAPKWDVYGRCLVRTVDNAIARGMHVLTPWWSHDLAHRVLPWMSEGMRQTAFTKVIGAKKAAWEADLAKTK